MRKLFLMTAAFLVAMGTGAQENKDQRTLDIHGTIRGKYEYQTKER